MRICPHPSLKLIAQRIALGILLLLAVSVLIFAGTQILPGDVAQSILGQSATPESLANLREQLGLNDPAYVRYFRWLGGVLTGDLGTALSSGQDIATSIKRTAVEHAVPRLLGGDRGGAAGDHPRPDRGALPQRLGRQADLRLALASTSLPEFFIGYVLVYFFAVKLSMVFPASRPSMTACPSASGCRRSPCRRRR